jgi:hypothetical protein
MGLNLEGVEIESGEAALRPERQFAQSFARTDAVSRPKKRPGRRAWSPSMILRA